MKWLNHFWFEVPKGDLHDELEIYKKNTLRV